MSLFIVGSVSRITSKIVHHLAKNSQYKAITIADVLPTYDYHHRFYRLQKQLDEAQFKLQLKLTRPNTINDVKGEGFDDVLYVTHDYYENVISKTKLMQTSALAWKNRKYLYFATPAEYDHFGFANPEANYTQAQKRVFQINPNSTVIRSDILEGTQTFASLNKTSNSNFKPKAVKSEDFVRAVCQTIAARAQGKRILIRGNEAVTSFSSDKSIEQSEFKHAKCNISELVSKYNGYTFKGYDGVNQA